MKLTIPQLLELVGVIRKLRKRRRAGKRGVLRRKGVDTSGNPPKATPTIAASDRFLQALPRAAEIAYFDMISKQARAPDAKQITRIASSRSAPENFLMRMIQSAKEKNRDEAPALLSAALSRFTGDFPDPDMLMGTASDAVDALNAAYPDLAVKLEDQANEMGVGYKAYWNALSKQLADDHNRSVASPLLDPAAPTRVVRRRSSVVKKSTSTSSKDVRAPVDWSPPSAPAIEEIKEEPERKQPPQSEEERAARRAKTARDREIADAQRKRDETATAHLDELKNTALRKNAKRQQEAAARAAADAENRTKAQLIAAEWIRRADVNEPLPTEWRVAIAASTIAKEDVSALELALKKQHQTAVLDGPHRDGGLLDGAKMAASMLSEGKGLAADPGLSSDDIIMLAAQRPLLSKQFGGVITRADLANPPNKKQAWVVHIPNKGSRTQGHWVAVYVDKPRGVIEYYDSFGKEPSASTRRALSALAKTRGMDAPLLKVNAVPRQSVTSSNCGFHALWYLDKRTKLGDAPGAFAMASGFSDLLHAAMDAGVSPVGNGESVINKYKREFRKI